MKRAIPAFVFAFLAFICFILVTVTAPFIKGLYVVHVETTKDAAFGINLGVFGSCFPGSTSLLGIQLSKTACSTPAYPYSLNAAYFGSEAKGGVILKALNNIAKGLILNPFAAAFALVALIPSLIAMCTQARFTQMLTWILLIVATLCSWAAFFVNIAFAVVAKNRVKENTNGEFVASYGNAVWISLVGAVLMTIAMFLALFGACCCVKQRKEEHHDVEAEDAHAKAVAEKEAQQARDNSEEHAAGDHTAELATAEHTTEKSKFAFWKH
ncbi:uncharacterized protein EHS24_008217 [Apiotrichum porosum]|uniref:Uncharacterized protein n=1 Tax=Apiotrichum porosum TaxID=105984 RepID=A0A427XT73_9TREE|nr:uncharacterized protein EHS24_008217 [Apiotrichum porosum]RSH82013.1 hypothetical protein EHS24_008217 [Apiotrichum porosum]